MVCIVQHICICVHVGDHRVYKLWQCAQQVCGFMCRVDIGAVGIDTDYMWWDSIYNIYIIYI